MIKNNKVNFLYITCLTRIRKIDKVLKVYTNKTF